MVNAWLWQQRANANAEAVYRDNGRGGEDLLVSARLPTLRGSAVIQLFVDPRDQAARQRYAGAWQSSPLRVSDVTLRSISGSAGAGSASSAAT